MTITWSPASINGVYRGFSLPIRMRATCEARRPSVCPLASTTYHLRTISPCLGKYVDIGTLPDLKKGCERKPLVDSPDEDARTIRRATTLLPKSLIYRTLRAIVNALFGTMWREEREIAS